MCRKTFCTGVYLILNNTSTFIVELAISLNQRVATPLLLLFPRRGSDHSVYTERLRQPGGLREPHSGPARLSACPRAHDDACQQPFG